MLARHPRKHATHASKNNMLFLKLAISESFTQSTILPGSIVSAFFAWNTTRVSPSKWLLCNSGTGSFFSMSSLQYSFLHSLFIAQYKTFSLIIGAYSGCSISSKKDLSNSFLKQDYFNNLLKSLAIFYCDPMENWRLDWSSLLSWLLLSLSDGNS